MGRSALGIAAGIISAFAIVTAAEWIGGILYPQAAPVDWTEQVAVSEWVQSIPLAAKLIVVAGWFGGALGGGFAAGQLSGRHRLGWVPALLVLAGGIANITMIPHPLWMTVAALLLPIAGGWLGTTLARRRPATGHRYPG